ncbi:MAG: hypothetical protein WAW13_04095 [Minisyncoccia bacterium]
MFGESPKLVRAESAGENRETELMQQREIFYAECMRLPAVEEAFALLDTLPSHLRYHTKEHTIDVIKETILFALADGVSRGVIEQQVIAAAWHDVGYVEQDKGNEPIAVKLFENSASFPQLDVEIRNEIISNIADTTVVIHEGSPNFHMSHSSFGYMLDGDLSNFGRDDFFTCMDKIAEETGVNLSNQGERTKMYAFVIALLENHTWHTEGAHMLRNAKKQRNLALLKSEYANLTREAA